LPWEKNYNETDVLERAMHAFWSHGYEATSMSDLVAATGINRGSIYAAYTNKHNLFMETLRHYDRIYRQQFLERVARENVPKDAILAAFEAAATQGNSSKTPGGCLLVNTVLELSPHDADVRDFVDASLREVENFFALMIKAAQRDGSISEGLDARQAAQALLGLFLGLRVLTRSRPHRAALKAITSQASMMLE
jgi:TetR/AcrR family transcriptional repressor of nem operon